MKSSRITLDLPESLLKSLKQSKLGQNCSSVNEAVRACIRNTVGIESSLKETTGQPCQKQGYQNER